MTLQPNSALRPAGPARAPRTILPRLGSLPSQRAVGNRQTGERTFGLNHPVWTRTWQTSWVLSLLAVAHRVSAQTRWRRQSLAAATGGRKTALHRSAAQYANSQSVTVATACPVPRGAIMRVHAHLGVGQFRCLRNRVVFQTRMINLPALLPEYSSSMDPGALSMPSWMSSRYVMRPSRIQPARSFTPSSNRGM
jgi:hypothetical protein